jgi:hypothetical protein
MIIIEEFKADDFAIESMDENGSDIKKIDGGRRKRETERADFSICGKS